MKIKLLHEYTLVFILPRSGFVQQQVSSPIKKYPFSKIVFTVASSITLAGLLFPSQGAAEEQVDL
ncbi:hypothetical protein JWJ90_23090, partial [Desulfobulbus rhabdoformis]|uniref:hypothetical protein n=1 Tax=Desulfobulbus rhabdoformis TaxID=34032 RepID=UPI0019662CB9